MFIVVTAHSGANDQGSCYSEWLEGFV